MAVSLGTIDMDLVTLPQSDDDCDDDNEVNEEEEGMTQDESNPILEKWDWNALFIPLEMNGFANSSRFTSSQYQSDENESDQSTDESNTKQSVAPPGLFKV